ncbi:lamin tail domain-containing protein [Chryseobacterium sp. RP-3-3]|uniref:Lamin tail domain-containing protein n=1 Tax=Chryseobacterium antibioticum TaxID=2728847 RepID=A0A7Y0ARK0_9FLAO|nr:lamin tail domain-containing protein [Chryseobacterium antibioticum]NML72094.1 lamin tail domain-containing protein [Chryseobacterium antibioticum]
MKMKFIICLLLFISTNWLYSQVMITEVYTNTPDNEMLRYNRKVNGVPTGEIIDKKKHHRGEFIEIYNFSDKEVNLKNWYLKDLQGIFWFPEITIKSRKFLVIAYSVLPYNTTPFTELFTTTAGKQSQIIYQDKILLRNKKDKISLGYSFNGYTLLEKSEFVWEFWNEPNSNYIQNIWSTPADFYTIKSIQYHPDPQTTMDPNAPQTIDTYNYTATPNPLEAEYIPDMESYDEIVKEDFQQNYSFLDWSDNVNFLVNKLCPITIEKISQSPSGSFTGNGGACFSYDSAGNLIAGSNCGSSSTPPVGSSGLTTDELEEIKNNITIYPNPTKASDQYNVTITWSGPALGKIQSLQVFNATGLLVYNYTPGINTTSCSLQNQLPGSFVANFILNTGQVVSKNILKW